MKMTTFVDYELFTVEVEAVAPLDAPRYSSVAVLKALSNIHSMQGRTHGFSSGGTKLGRYRIPSAPVTASGIYSPLRARAGETAKIRFSSFALTSEYSARFCSSQF
jgi:hypothetical protein